MEKSCRSRILGLPLDGTTSWTRNTGALSSQNATGLGLVDEHENPGHRPWDANSQRCHRAREPQASFRGAGENTRLADRGAAPMLHLAHPSPSPITPCHIMTLIAIIAPFRVDEVA